MKRETISLFSDYDLSVVLEAQGESVHKRIEQIPARRLLVEKTEDLLAELEKDLRIEAVILKEDEITVEQSEVKVDVSHDIRRAIFDRSRPFYVDGVRVTYYVPFSGDPELLKCRPNAFNLNPPHARITNHELLFEYDITDGNATSTRSAFDQALRNVHQWLKWSGQQVEEYNRRLTAIIQQKLAARAQRLKESQQQITNLGFKVRPKSVDSEPVKVPVPNKSTSRSRTRKSPVSKRREYDVALSFAGEERAYVEQVATLLREANIRVFYDGFEEVDLWGKDLVDHFAEIYAKRSRFIVMFASKHYAAKAWTNHERKHALARALQEQEIVVLPARFDDTEIPGLPNTVGYIDLRKITPDDLVNRILQKLGLPTSSSDESERVQKIEDATESVFKRRRSAFEELAKGTE